MLKLLKGHHCAVRRKTQLSLIVPLKQMIEHSMAFNEEASFTVSNMERATLNNLSDRYYGEYNYMLV